MCRFGGEAVITNRAAVGPLWGVARELSYLLGQPKLPGARPATKRGLCAMETVFLLPLLLLVALSPRGGSPQHERMQSSPVPPVTSAPFLVLLSPELQAVPPGGSVWLNCSHSCPLPVRSSLHTQLRQGKTRRGSGWVSYQLLDVRAWSSKVRCVITCAGETREATARITAYSEEDRDSGRAGVRGEGWRKGGSWQLLYRRCLPALPFLP